MIVHSFLKTLAVLALNGLVLASCAPAPQPEPTRQPARESTVSPRLPGRIVVTDGHGDIHMALAGNAQCAATSGAETAAALASTNAIRAQRGLAPLSVDPRLQRAAESHACEMARRGTMTHVGGKSSGPMARIKQLGYKPRMAAENIAGGRFDLGRVQSEWVNSPNHRANLLLPQTRHFGLGRAVAADGKTVFWSAVFAQPKG